MINDSFYSDNPASSFPVSLNQIQVSSVPEPGTWALLLIGFGGVGYALRRRGTARPRVSFG